MPAFLALSVIPIAGGAARLTELATGAAVTPDNARFFAAPLPVVLHILSASVFAFVGAFQFSPGARRSRPGWHRAAGRVLVPSGIVAAASGIWMTAFYPPWPDGELVAALRLLFGSAMMAFLLLGVGAIRRRDFARHGRWMLRGYAVGIAAGTQSAILLPWVLLLGFPGALTEALLMAAGWVITLAVAEWVIRRERAVPPPLPRSVRAGWPAEKAS